MAKNKLAATEAHRKLGSVGLIPNRTVRNNWIVMIREAQTCRKNRRGRIAMSKLAAAEAEYATGQTVWSRRPSGLGAVNMLTNKQVEARAASNLYLRPSISRSVPG